MTFTLYSWIQIASALISLAMGVAVWKRRSAPGATYLALLEFAIAEWALTGALDAAANTVPLKILWSKISYPGINAASVLFVLFIVEYNQHRRKTSPRVIGLLSIIPALTVLFALTNELHGWIWSHVSIDPRTHLGIYEHGVWFWIWVPYVYGTLTVALFVLYRAMVRFPAFYRSHMAALLVASLLPIAGNVIYVLGLNPIPGFDWTLVSFAASGAILGWMIFRQQMFRIVPIARNVLVENMADGILVLDLQNRIVDINPAAQAILGLQAREAIGQPMPDSFVQASDGISALLDGAAQEVEISLDRDGEQRTVDMRITPIRDRRNRLSGRLLALRDVTRRKQMERERERLILELQNAIEEVQTLSGLLPICANCKKIRDDQGYWHSVEAYVTDRSGAIFSHSICPDCAREYYPELADEPDTWPDAAK